MSSFILVITSAVSLPPSIFCLLRWLILVHCILKSLLHSNSNSLFPINNLYGIELLSGLNSKLKLVFTLVDTTVDSVGGIFVVVVDSVVVKLILLPLVEIVEVIEVVDEEVEGGIYVVEDGVDFNIVVDIVPVGLEIIVGAVVVVTGAFFNGTLGVEFGIVGGNLETGNPPVVAVVVTTLLTPLTTVVVFVPGGGLDPGGILAILYCGGITVPGGFLCTQHEHVYIF